MAGVKQSPPTRDRIIEFFEVQQSTSAVFTYRDVARAIERSHDTVKMEMMGLHNSGMLRRAKVNNAWVYWMGDDPMELSAPRPLLALEAIDVRSTIVAA